MTNGKSTTRKLSEASLCHWTQRGVVGISNSPWVKKGSKRNLWKERSIERAIDYVINGQGDELPNFD